jgi:hypothetical protein
MDCYRHGGVASVATCVGCSQPICEECREEVAGHAMCQPCVAAAEARLSQPPAPWLAQESSAVEGAAIAGEAPAAGASPPETLTEQAAELPEGTPPGLLRRLGRGWLWGIWHGQWWTLMTVVSGFIWGRGWPGNWMVVGLAFFYGFFGSITGIIIGAANASISTGTAIGVGMGILVCLLETLMEQDARMLINLIFFFFTGQFVGAGITARVQQPVATRET